MRLSHTDADCLVVSTAGYLAQKRLARGLRLNHPETVALISSQVTCFVCPPPPHHGCPFNAGTQLTCLIGL